MPFRSSAHLLFWLLGIAVCVVLVLLAIDVGLFDQIFHTSTREPFHNWIEAIGKTNIDLAFKVLGLIFTAIFGMLAFLKGWHYAELNMPLRLAEFVDKLKQATFHERELVLAPYASTSFLENPSGKHEKTLFETFMTYLRNSSPEKLADKLVEGG